MFNQPVDDLPNVLTHLTFGDAFNQPVDDLPNALTHLTFSDAFNQPVNDLPNALTHLTFGDAFNQLVNDLPNALTHLTFGDAFNQLVDNLPNNLIEFAFSYASQIKNSIPENIEKIKILFNYYDKYTDTIENIPCHIKQIKINDKTQIHYFKKIPFGCKVVDEENNELF